MDSTYLNNRSLINNVPSEETKFHLCLIACSNALACLPVMTSHRYEQSICNNHDNQINLAYIKEISAPVHKLVFRLLYSIFNCICAKYFEY